MDLKLIELAGRHSHIGEFSEASVDAIDGFARGYRLINQTAASLEAGQRVAVQYDARFGRTCDPDHIVNREVLAVQRYGRGWHCNKSKRCNGYREQGPQQATLRGEAGRVAGYGEDGEASGCRPCRPAGRCCL